MKNSDIKYNLSKDYNKLYDLLKKGNIIIGFIAVGIDNISSMEYSKVTTMHYNSDHKFFDIGFTVFEMDFDKNKFIEICKKENVRFFDLNHIDK